MNGFEFNDLSNKEKMEFITNNGIEVICIGGTCSKIFFYYNEKSDEIQIENEVLEEVCLVKELAYCGNNRFKVIYEVPCEECGDDEMYLDIYIYREAFDKDDNFKG